MNEKEYSKSLTVFLVIGIILVIGVLIALGISTVINNASKASAQDAVEQFQGGKGTVEEETKISNKQNNVVTNTESVTPTLGIENVLVSTEASTKKAEKQMYKGFPMVGTIEIPSIKLSYPVLESASKSAIEVAVAIYEGVGLNKVGNTTIVGHNYRNGTLFSDLQKVKIGDKVYITDESKTKITYVVYNIYTTSPEDSSYMDRDTEGKREITLDTCTDDSQSRVLVFAREQ